MNDEAETDPVFEYARLFGEIAAWVREGGERGGPFSRTWRRDADGTVITLDDMPRSPAGRFSALTWKPVANLSSVVAYLRPDALVSRGNPTHGHMCRCDLRGGGRREWPADDYVPLLQALRDRISAAWKVAPPRVSVVEAETKMTTSLPYLIRDFDREVSRIVAERNDITEHFIARYLGDTGADIRDTMLVEQRLPDRYLYWCESRPKDGPTPGDWKDRLLAESTELAARLARLTAFVRGGGPAFAALPEADRALLIRQREAMLEYSRVLGERIGRAGGEAKGS